MPDDKSTPRILQQQPARDSDPEQQRSGSADFQSRGEAAPGGQVEGEGSYTATRNYQKDIKEYMEKADIESDMEKSRPRSESEARDLDEAEREGKSHSKGER